jgi:hypothetical protein
MNLPGIAWQPGRLAGLRRACSAGMVPCRVILCAVKRARWPRAPGLKEGARLRIWAGQACCGDGVRGCPRGSADGSLRVRTYSGQRLRGIPCQVVFLQVRWHIKVQAGEYCKTVGSAYVGSNPTPATTSGNGPSAAETRPAGRFLLVTSCIAMCHRVSMRRGVHGHIADGVRAARTVGAHRRLFHGRPRTGRACGVSRLRMRR